jgi:hypothetical protein
MIAVSSFSVNISSYPKLPTEKGIKSTPSIPFLLPFGVCAGKSPSG